MAEHKKHGIGIYVVVALILAVITYVEFAIVEYPVAWLTPGQVMFWLIAMSVVKFWMVIWFFMHLKDDPKIYTGFFSSGMFIAMGTFVALSFMFILPGAVAPEPNVAEVEARTAVLAALRSGAAHEADAYDDHGAAPAEAGRATPPADRTLAVTPPAAATDGFGVDLEARAVEPAPATDAAAPEAAVLAQAGADPGYDTALGASTYAANCSACHQASGAGLPGVFPPLAGHADDLYAVDGGRTYLIDVLLYGLQGPIDVDGTAYNGLMPAWAQLSDDQIAAVINHSIVGLDGTTAPAGFDAIRPDEVAAQRGQGLTGTDVLALRTALDLNGAAAPETPAAPEAAAETPAAAPEATDAVLAQSEADPTYDTELGAATYAANCVACHQATGAGIPSVFPPLAGHAADLYAATGGIGGRAFLIDVLLYGLQGAITVNGAAYNGLMPGWQQLSDDQIAAVINHVVAGFDGAPDGFDAIRADEVAAARGQGLAGGAVYELRGALGLE
jgi:mono/diheme cytochrome c family protein